MVSGMTDTRLPRGARTLAAEARRRGGIAALGRFLGISPQRIRGWIAGICRPNADARALLLGKLGIALDAWGRG